MMHENMNEKKWNNYKFFYESGIYMLMQLTEKCMGPRITGNPIGRNLSINFSPFIRRNESQIAVWAPRAV